MTFERFLGMWLSTLSFMESRDGVQDQEIAPMSPDPSPRRARGWGLGTRLIVPQLISKLISQFVRKWSRERGVARVLSGQGGRTRSRVTHIMPSQQKVSHSVAVIFYGTCFVFTLAIRNLYIRAFFVLRSRN